MGEQDGALRVETDLETRNTLVCSARRGCRVCRNCYAETWRRRLVALGSAVCGR